MLSSHGSFLTIAIYHNGETIKVSKGAKIRKRYNQIPHLTQYTNGKVTNLQLDTTKESQEVSPFPTGDHKAHINRRTQRHSNHKTEKNIKDLQKKYHLERSVKCFTGGLKPVLLRAMTHRFFGLHERPLTYQCIIS